MSKWVLYNNEIEKNKDLNSEIIREILNSNENEIILCIGQVQSGKTSKIIQIIENAIEYKYDYIILFGGSENVLLEQTYERINKHFFNNDKVNVIKNKEYKINERNLRTNVYVVLKNISHINNWLEESQDKDFREKKVLIIDDECDYGSINKNENELSAIYNGIKKLYERMHFCKIFQITATPYANILSSNSIEIRPNKVLCWKPNHGYTGWEFFQKNDFIYEKINKKISDDINDYRDTILSAIIKHFYASFKLYKNIGINEKSDLLINISLRTDEHNKIKNICDFLLEKIKESKITFYKHYSEKDSNNKISKNDFDDFIDYYLDNIRTKVLNSKFKDENFSSVYSIIIGGTKISRGNTYENLMVELFLNAPKGIVNVDTLLQRCRWFGYRKNERVKYMKVILNDHIYDSLCECKEYINLFKEGIYSINSIKNELIKIDEKNNFVKGTSYEKSK